MSASDVSGWHYWPTIFSTSFPIPPRSGPQVTSAEILEGQVSPPREATILYNLLLNYTDRISAPVS